MPGIQFVKQITFFNQIKLHFLHEMSNLVPKISNLTAPWSVPGGGKMRDPGNKVVKCLDEFESVPKICYHPDGYVS